MILADGHIFVHMPRTAGTSVSAVLARQGGYIVGERHDPISRADPALRCGRAVFGTVRDPWSWYASLYLYAATGSEGLRRLPGVGYNGCTYSGAAEDFRRFLWGATHLAETAMPFVLGVIWQPAKPETADPERDSAVWDSASQMRRSGLGLWGWSIDHFYRDGGEWAVDALVDSAQLAAGLRAIGVLEPTDPRPDRLNHLRARPLKIAIPDPRSLYNDEAREWVAAADAPHIDRFGYRPFTSSACPAHRFDLARNGRQEVTCPTPAT